MDSIENKIVEGLRSIARLYGGGSQLQGAIVKTTDTVSYTCDVVTDEDEEIPNVLYKSVTGGDVNVVFEPAQGSRVLIMQLLDSDEWVILKYGAVANIFTNAPQVVFNDGTLGGLVKIEPLITKINALESSLNALKTAFNSWIVVPNDGGAALKTVSATWAGQTIVATVKSDLENTKIKQ